MCITLRRLSEKKTTSIIPVEQVIFYTIGVQGVSATLSKPSTSEN